MNAGNEAVPAAASAPVEAAAPAAVSEEAAVNAEEKPVELVNTAAADAGDEAKSGTQTPAEKPDRTKNGGGEGSGRLPKRRAAVLVGYCGTGYSGMQMYVFERYMS